MLRSRNVQAALLALAAAGLAALAGLKRFEAWEQVTDLWASGVSPLLLAATGHPHFFRYLTAYPGFLLDDAWPGYGFSLYIALFMAFNVGLWRHLALLLSGRAPSLALWSVFLLAHAAMNGRGVIAWSAWLLCVLLCVRLSRGEAGRGGALAAAAVACWLAAVSTGVFIVTVVALMVFYLQFRRSTPGRPLRKLLLALLVLPLVGYVVRYLLLAVKKNIDFFGGGLDGAIHMLSHGLGRLLFGSELLAMLLVFGAAMALLFMVVLTRLRERRWSPLEQLLGLAVFGGMFGLTVLTLALPVMLLYLQQRAALAAARAGQPAGA